MNTETGGGRPLYRGMDRATLDAAYRAAASIPDVESWRLGWVERSERFRRDHQGQLNLPYGAAPRAKLDFFPAAKRRAPTVMFMHGGYWYRNSKDNFSFAAAGPYAHGFNVAVVGYSLAPEARMDQIVREIGEAATWLAANLARLGGDPGSLFAMGWSAGGHLVAMNIAHPAIKGGVSVSGIYDLEPMRLGELNAELHLDEAEARRNSPLLHIPTRAPHLVVGVGGAELPEFRRQASEFFAAWQGRGLPGTFIELPNCHHYLALEEVAKPDGLATAALRRLAFDRA